MSRNTHSWERQNWGAKRKNDFSGLYDKENSGGSKFKGGSKERNKKVFNCSGNDEKNEFINQEIGIGDVNIARNLVGIGTNLAISPGVEENGDCLHVIVTFMPVNERVEKLKILK